MTFGGSAPCTVRTRGSTVRDFTRSALNRHDRVAPTTYNGTRPRYDKFIHASRPAKRATAGTRHTSAGPRVRRSRFHLIIVRTLSTTRASRGGAGGKRKGEKMELRNVAGPSRRGPDVKIPLARVRRSVKGPTCVFTANSVKSIFCFYRSGILFFFSSGVFRSLSF